MKYGYLDLGRLPAGTIVVVTVRGGGAQSILLLTAADFVRYRSERSFRYQGGGYRGRPVRIEVPHDDYWFVVMELGTYNGRARAQVKVLPPHTEAEPVEAVVEA